MFDSVVLFAENVPSGSSSSWSLLLSGITGVAVSVIAGFVGASLQNKREHLRWLRDIRFSSFTELLEYLRIWDRLTQEINTTQAAQGQVRAAVEMLKARDLDAATRETILEDQKKLTDLSSRLEKISEKLPVLRERLVDIEVRWHSVAARSDILAPRDLQEKIFRLNDLLADRERTGFKDLKTEIESEMRELLNISEPKASLLKSVKTRTASLRESLSDGEGRLRGGLRHARDDADVTS